MSRHLHRILVAGSICLVTVIAPASATAQHATPLFREWNAVEASGWQAAALTQVASTAPDSKATRIFFVSAAAVYPAGIAGYYGCAPILNFHTVEGLLCVASLQVALTAGMSSLAGAHFIDGVLGSAIGTSTFFLLGNDLLRAVAFPLITGLATTMLYKYRIYKYRN